MHGRSDAPPRFSLGSVIFAIVVVGIVLATLGAGVVAYHAVRAARAEDPTVNADLDAAFADVSRSWVSHMDLPVRRVVLVSVEEYGSGNLIFVFEAYTWTGVGAGFATWRGAEATAGGGGLIRDGGFAGLWEHTAPELLEEVRAAWRAAYGPGRELVPRK